MIGDAIRKLSKTNDEIYSVIGKVIAVNGDTCDVELLTGGDAIIYDCRLQVFKSDSSGVQITPKLRSIVIVAFLEKHVAYCALYSEIESVEWHIGQRIVRFNDGGLLIQNQNETLLSVLTEVLDAHNSVLSLLKKGYNVLTPAGVSTGIAPNSIVAIEAQAQKIAIIKTKLQKILC
jgi:hypothetical protein